MSVATAAAPLTFYDHVRELRTRLAWCFGVLLIGGIVGYYFRAPIVAFLQKPLHAPLFYFSPTAGFNFVLKVATCIGVLAALPVFLYHTVRFIEPALSVKIRPRLLMTLITASLALSVLGIAFAYYWLVPTSLHFFAGYSSAIVKPLIGTDEYLSFIISSLLTFALIFQIPLIILFINRIWPLTPSMLLHYQRHIIVGAFALAVILPFTYDPVTQFIIAIPIVFLYYLSIVLLGIFGSSPPKSSLRQTVEVRPVAPPRPIRLNQSPDGLSRPLPPLRRQPTHVIQPLAAPLRLDGLSGLKRP